MRFSNQDIGVVIRSVSERTEPLAKYAILAQGIPETCVRIARGGPFHKTLSVSIADAAIMDKAWTMMVDADIIPAPYAIARTVDIINSTPERDRVFCFQTRTYDKFYEGTNPGGIHTYQTSHLSRHSAAVKPDSGRPERNLIEAATHNGKLEHLMLQDILGVHGHHQYFRDIFRSFYFRAKKNSPMFPRMQLESLARRIDVDPDFGVALLGLACGMNDSKPRNHQPNLDFNRPPYVEKPPLETAEISTLFQTEFTMCSQTLPPHGLHEHFISLQKNGPINPTGIPGRIRKLMDKLLGTA